MQANPTVNRYLKDKAMDRIDHALGRPVWPLRETYRNHFATDAAGVLAVHFACSPHWTLTGQQGEMAFFAVTEMGRNALSEHLETLDEGARHRAYIITFEGYESIIPAKSRSHARYAYWLRVSDSFSELTFGDFIRNSGVRVAA